MAATTSFVVIIFLPLLTLLFSSPGDAHPPPCNPFSCDNLDIISFPLFDSRFPKCGGLCEADCHNKTIPPYNVVNISRADIITIRDHVREQTLRNRSCDAFNNLSFPSSPSISFSIIGNIKIFKCPEPTNDELYYRYIKYPGYTLFYKHPHEPHPETNTLSQGCSVVQLPFNVDDPFQFVSHQYLLGLHVSDDCYNCKIKGGKCDASKLDRFHCANPTQDGSKSIVILASVIPGGFIIIICIIGFIIWRRNKWNHLPYFLSRNVSSDLSPSARDPEGGTIFFGIPVFPYSVLEEATNNFDTSKELGDGGFGTVYHGILRDGREVAVKRLYENNCKRVEQFINEIEILTRLRHPHLVQLYGCTSRRSTELLLVYEYIPNGTVDDHLHGDRAKTGTLTWPIRMSIAIETASALSYLHKSDIIHRDVKTNNILLDNGFCVKVADFGLSRLFPIGVTHVSTAPQGTPGYVDPEYHQCYQLTDRSDVYSFGVVLIELISSMPAVDICRHRHEINLANLAINRIQRCAFNELIDPSLGYETDSVVQRMTTSVAELAFQCLQFDKEMRPTMDEVLETLKDIRDYEFKVERSVGPPPSPESEGKIAKFKSSSDSVSDKWVGRNSTTSSASG